MNPSPTLHIVPRYYYYLKFIFYLNAFNNWVATSIPPGPKRIKMKYIINFQKGGTLFYVLFLMFYFNNFSTTSYLYLSLHGTYGILWLLKDRILPDSSWERKSTFLSAIAIFFLVLGPYWASAYLIIKNRIVVSELKMVLCIFLHTLGCVVMMSSDTQKYFVLKEKKELITNGWFKKSRNPNYLGEMMIYLTYALLGVSATPYYILVYIWGLLFHTNMRIKDVRIQKKDGGKEYLANSSLLLPI